MNSTAILRTSIIVAASAALAWEGLVTYSTPGQARDFIKGDRPQQRGYSMAVITEGGKTVWLAGQTATVDDPATRIAREQLEQSQQGNRILNQIAGNTERDNAWNNAGGTIGGGDW